MNKINRPLVKSQAKQLIKDKIFPLFLICVIVIVLTGGASSIFTINKSFENIVSQSDNRFEDSYPQEQNDYDDFEDFLNGEFGFGSQDSQNPFDSFEENYNNHNSNNNNVLENIRPKFTVNIGSFVPSLIAFILNPLTVTLSGLFVLFIRRRSDEEFKLSQQLGNLFTFSFNESYLKKLVLYCLRNILIGLLILLFIIPGVIYYYSTYFSYEIMCDNPNLKPSEVLKLSKKIIKGNRTELFVLDLSFILWYLLVGVTFGIASVYVLPYVNTTRALYYENFRLRAISEGRVTDDDFLSEDELREKYNSFQSQNNAQSYYNPDINNAQPTNYYTPSEHNDYAQAGQEHTPDNGAQSGYYYNPAPQDNTPQSEDTQYYNPPEQPDGENDNANM